MNSLYLQQTRSLLISFSTIIILITSLFIIAQSAAFLSITLESGLSSFVFLKFLILQIPVQLKTLIPLSLAAASTSVFTNISNEGEHWVLRAAGVNERSFYYPAILTGALLSAFYMVLSFNLSPWALMQLKMIDRESRELVAQNTIINPGEPTYIGAAEIVVKETTGSSLEQINLFGTDSTGDSIFASAEQADFFRGPTGLSLVMRNGQIIQSNESEARVVQQFNEVLIDLSPLIEQETATDLSQRPAEISLISLLSSETFDTGNAVNNRREALRRLANPFLIFITPIWILFWQLEAKASRSQTFSIALIGPVSLLPALVLVETPALYAHSWVVFGSVVGAILLIGGCGPLISHARHLTQEKWMTSK